MPAAILNQGKTAIRDVLKNNLVTHVAVTDDATAFDATQTRINPAAGATSTHVEASTDTDVGTDGFDAVMTVTGDTEFTNKVIMCLAIADGPAIRSAGGTGTHTGAGNAAGTDTISRSVRGAGLGWGVQAGDILTVGARLTAQDNS